jgi:hypothetical protein
VPGAKFGSRVKRVSFPCCALFFRDTVIASKESGFDGVKPVVHVSGTMAF